MDSKTDNTFPKEQNLLLLNFDHLYSEDADLSQYKFELSKLETKIFLSDSDKILEPSNGYTEDLYIPSVAPKKILIETAKSTSTILLLNFFSRILTVIPLLYKCNFLKNNPASIHRPPLSHVPVDLALSSKFFQTSDHFEFQFPLNSSPSFTETKESVAKVQNLLT